MRLSNVSLTEILKALENFDLDAAPIFGGETELNAIHSYSRAQAIEDGVLIDVTKQAKEIGIRFPTALTAGVWAEAVASPFGIELPSDMWETSRVNEILELAMSELETSTTKCVRSVYHVPMTLDDSKRIELMATVSLGDDGRHVLTVMLPHED